MTPRPLPDLVDIEQELFELPHRVSSLVRRLQWVAHIYTGTRYLQQRSSDDICRRTIVSRL